jgi:hypothetical protein
MDSYQLEELRELIVDDSSSNDSIHELCLELGGYIEVIAQLLGKIPTSPDVEGPEQTSEEQETEEQEEWEEEQEED